MKRRSQKEPPRDREMEQVKAMTTVTLTEGEMRNRLRADKAALEEKLKYLFVLRRLHNSDRDEIAVGEVNELIKSVSAELRNVKAQLR